VAEISEVHGNGNLDPWNRPMPERTFVETDDSGVDKVDADGEVGAYVCWTSVCGLTIELTLLND
jgi:hypothetical protein